MIKITEKCLVISIFVILSSFPIMSQSFKASSVLVEGEIVYDPEYLMDGKIETAWCEGVDGVGIGEWIRIELENSKQVAAIVIYPGFLRDQSSFLKNSIPTELLIRINDEDEFVMDTRINIKNVPLDQSDTGFVIDESKENRNGRYFFFSQPKMIKSIEIELSEITKGTKWEDTLISEIDFIEEDEFTSESKWSVLKEFREGRLENIDFSKSLILPDSEKYRLYHFEFGWPKGSTHHIDPDIRFSNNTEKELFFYLYGKTWFDQTSLLWVKDEIYYFCGSSAITGGGSEWIVVFPLIIWNSQNEIIELLESSYYGAVPEIKPRHPGIELFLPEEEKWKTKEFIPDFF